jgi:hypothetical protein
MAAEFLGKKKRQNMLELFSSSLRRMQQLRERGELLQTQTPSTRYGQDIKWRRGNKIITGVKNLLRG